MTEKEILARLELVVGPQGAWFGLPMDAPEARKRKLEHAVSLFENPAFRSLIEQTAKELMDEQLKAATELEMRVWRCATLAILRLFDATKELHDLAQEEFEEARLERLGLRPEENEQEIPNP